MFDNFSFGGVLKVGALIGAGVMIGRISKASSVALAKGDMQFLSQRLQGIRRELESVTNDSDPLSKREKALVLAQLANIEDQIQTVQREIGPDAASKLIKIKTALDEMATKASQMVIKTGKVIGKSISKPVGYVAGKILPGKSEKTEAANTPDQEVAAA